MTPDNTRHSGYRPDIDGLRAVAVSAVIAYHFYKDLLPGGFLGVDMFFVISGYVITGSLTRQPHDSFRVLCLDFYSRRIKRLLPALAVCILATCLLGTLFIGPEEAEYSSSMKAGFFSLFGVSNIYFFNEARGYFSSSAQLNLFTQTWSLGVEEQFYAVFPALFWVSENASGWLRGRPLLLAALGLLTILSFSLYVLLDKTMVNAAYFLMPPRFWELGIGCIAALVASQPLASGRPYLRPASWLAALLIVAALVAPADLHLYATPAIVVGTALLIMMLRPGALLYRLLTLRYVLSIGLMSYSLYLWYWSVLSISRWTIGVPLWSAPIQVGVMLGLAAASYVLVERPLRRAQSSRFKLVTIGFGLTALACSAGAIALLDRDGILSPGDPAYLKAAGADTLSVPKWYAGKLEWNAGACILASNDDVGKEITTDACTLAGLAPSKPHFLVVGNSFSAAEFEMYSVLSESGLGTVTATSSWGASPILEIPNTTRFSKANDYYWSGVVPALISHLSDGDVLLMLSYPGGVTPETGLTPKKMNEESADGLVIFKSGLNRLAGELRQKGVQIIFQTANPFLEEARCTPGMARRQWFDNGDRTRCVYYSKTESIARRQPLQQVLEDVEHTNPNFHILDLFPVLCPGDTCGFYDDKGVFLYRDEFSHPSIEADYMARPIFLEVVNSAIKASKGNLQSVEFSQ